MANRFSAVRSELGLQIDRINKLDERIELQNKLVESVEDKMAAIKQHISEQLQKAQDINYESQQVSLYTKDHCFTKLIDFNARIEEAEKTRGEVATFSKQAEKEYKALQINLEQLRKETLGNDIEINESI